MRVAQHWKDYELLDASGGERLERWGEVLLIRPDPQILWDTPKTHPGWKQAHARYLRSNTGGGKWEQRRPLPPSWPIRYGELTFQVKPMGFKHTGLFPEPVSYTHLDVYKRQPSDGWPGTLQEGAGPFCISPSEGPAPAGKRG